MGESGLVLLEHLNFKVPYPHGEGAIESFFVRALGCPECPPGRMRVSPPVRGPVPAGAPKQMHVNLGLSQIHFEWCTGDGRPYAAAQRLGGGGSVTLAVDDLGLLRRRLAGTGLVPAADSGDRVSLRDPLGMATWHCVEAPRAVRDRLARFGSVRPGGVGHVLAMSKVVFACRPGLSEGIVRFYERAFHAETFALPEGRGHGIGTAMGQAIHFEESPDAPPPNGYEVNGELWGVHMCFYVDAFEARCRELRDAFWVNPDYKIPPINDNVSTSEAAIEKRQFRLKKFTPESEFVLEHEIRAVDHPLSPLVVRRTSAL